MDDFVKAGNKEFTERIRKGIVDALIVANVEKDKFRFMGWDIEYEDVIKVLMINYAQSWKDITEIRKAHSTNS